MKKSHSKHSLPVAVLSLIAIGILGLDTPARASNIIQNGTFTQTTGTLGTGNNGGITTTTSTGAADYAGDGALDDWTVSELSGSDGLAILYTDENQGSTKTDGEGVTVNARFGGFSLYDPGNVKGTTPKDGAIPDTSPGGGNFIVADGSSTYNVAIYQTLNDLSIGATYSVSFYYAAGQQYNFTGNTTEGWQVSLTATPQLTEVAANGTTIQDTPTQAIVAGTGTPGLGNGDFQAWAYQTFSFKASAATEVLTFLSMGTPSGEPPADLLSDVSMSVPEPASAAIMGIGLAALLALVWFRKGKTRQVGNN